MSPALPTGRAWARSPLLLCLLSLVSCLGLAACSTVYTKSPSAPTPAATPTESPADHADPPAAPVALAPSVPVELQDSLRTDTYPVDGKTPGDIRADLNRYGPLSVTDGHRYDATTTWTLKWSLQYKQINSGCQLAGATVYLDMVILVPQLVDSPDLPAKALGVWQTYRQALETHEMGHVAGYRREAADLQQIFSTYSGDWQSCGTLGAALKAEGDARIDAILADDRDYDDATGHGRLQGAVYP